MMSEPKKAVDVLIKSRLCEILLRFISTNGLQIAPAIVLHSYIIRSSPAALFSILLFNIQTTYLSLLSIFSRASRVPVCAEFWKLLIDVRCLIPTYHVEDGWHHLFFLSIPLWAPLVLSSASFFITHRRWIYRGWFSPISMKSLSGRR